MNEEIERLREKFSSSLSKQKFQDQISQWEGLFRPDVEEDYFRGRENMPEFDPDLKEFSTSNAWWLGELCRIAYTPDHRESPRKWHEDKPDRTALLAERSPFQEALSIHKTGNHASIFLGNEATVLCFRGTKKLRQWIMNMLFRPHNWERFRKPDETDAAFVHSGFYVFYKRILPLFQEELEQYPRPWIFTGHSLGGALAMIAGLVAEPDAIYTFGSPKPGNLAFADLMLKRVQVYRITNGEDIVPLLPLPDEKQREKQFEHGGNHFHLNESGEIETSPSKERSLGKPFLFPSEFNPDDFGKAPAWIRDHRIGQYCGKLQKLSIDFCNPSDH